MKKNLLVLATLAMTLSGPVMADGHSMATPRVMADDQSVASGTVSAKAIAGENGWLVVHRTNEAMKPGPVVGYAPLRKGKNYDVVAILSETVKPGQHLMLMIHAEKDGNKTGIFEYSLGAKEDGPIKPDGKLVMKVITAQ